MTRLVVAPGGLISSAWGNQAMDQGVIIFTSAAQRDADWPAPPAGAQCYVTGVGWQRRVGGAWVTTIDAASTGGAVVNVSGARLIAAAATTVTTQASGSFSVNHGLGVVPNWAVMTCMDRVTAGSAWWPAMHRSNFTSTVLEAVAYGPTGAVMASKPIWVGWIAGVL